MGFPSRARTGLFWARPPHRCSVPPPVDTPSPATLRLNHPLPGPHGKGAQGSLCTDGPAGDRGSKPHSTHQALGQTLPAPLETPWVRWGPSPREEPPLLRPPDCLICGNQCLSLGKHDLPLFPCNHLSSMRPGPLCLEIAQRPQSQHTNRNPIQRESHPEATRGDGSKAKTKTQASWVPSPSSPNPVVLP